MSLTAEQVATRRQFLGGTDLAALAGFSPYAKPIDVWRDKTEGEVRDTNRMMALGTVLEPVVAGLFAQATGMRTRRQERPVRDKHRPYLGGHLDRLVYPGDSTPATLPPGILECKWAQGRRQWGDVYGLDLWNGTTWEPAQVPAHYAVQVQHYLGVTGHRIGYLAVLLGYADFRWYALPRDDETIGLLRDLAADFWHTNVEAGVPPEPDGTEAYGDWLAARYTADGGGDAVATAAQQSYAEDLRHALERARAAQADVEAAKQRLQASMGDTGRLVLPNGTITWRAHEVKRVAWQSVARSVLGTAHPDLPADELEGRLAQVAGQFTTTTTQRPFRPEFEEEKDVQD